MSRYLWRLIAVSLALAVVLGAAPATQAQPSAPRYGTPRADGDYEIPNGWFYTQAAPGQHGNGYRVANEAGIPFWDAFQAQGGVEKLGYPLTRRFTWNGTVVQAFQNGALRWLPTESRAELRPLRDIGDPPADAKRAELPLAFGGEAQRKPWSGWWWPANDVVGGPRLFDLDGPLARYDRYVESLGKPDPETVAWERAEIRFSGLAWAGHCNGWAAAALLEPEPSRERTVNGMTFSVADQKGLLTSYHFADAAAWAVGSEQVDVGPADFHRAVTAWIGGERKGAVFTYRPVGEEIWSYPAYKFETEIGPDPQEANLWRVRTTVWLVDNNVPAGFVGSSPWPAAAGKVLEYTLTGPDPHRPTGGAWSPRTDGRFARPFMVWYPDPGSRNLGRQLASPNLDYGLIRQITRGPAPKPLFDPRPRLDGGSLAPPEVVPPGRFGR
ncbi:MAG: hypothetical protein IT306_00980 [Chloroflexi bacterium]|nr:hypothetical protein [Chloroflexota bacterium]